MTCAHLFISGNYTCDEHEFQCANKVCISELLRCDHNVDCIDGSDELDCSKYFN